MAKVTCKSKMQQAVFGDRTADVYADGKVYRAQSYITYNATTGVHRGLAFFPVNEPVLPRERRLRVHKELRAKERMQAADERKAIATEWRRRAEFRPQMTAEEEEEQIYPRGLKRGLSTSSAEETATEKRRRGEHKTTYCQIQEPCVSKTHIVYCMFCHRTSFQECPLYCVDEERRSRTRRRRTEQNLNNKDEMRMTTWAEYPHRDFGLGREPPPNDALERVNTFIRNETSAVLHKRVRPWLKGTSREYEADAYDARAEVFERAPPGRNGSGRITRRERPEPTMRDSFYGSLYGCIEENNDEPSRRTAQFDLVTIPVNNKRITMEDLEDGRCDYIAVRLCPRCKNTGSAHSWCCGRHFAGPRIGFGIRCLTCGDVTCRRRHTDPDCECTYFEKMGKEEIHPDAVNGWEVICGLCGTPDFRLCSGPCFELRRSAVAGTVT